VPISASQCWRICTGLDLKPWQVQSWMTSHDRDFWETVSDVCGLYLKPPVNAVVWSVDEKSQMQAKSRVNPTTPARPGAPVRRDCGYVRHGTQVLFAGLNVHTGEVAGWMTDSTRSENFVEFLADLVSLTPKPLQLHCIVDNLSAHMTAKVEAFSGQEPAGAHALHPHPCRLAQPGRVVLLHPRAPNAQAWRVRLHRRAGHTGDHLHQRLQPQGRPVPLDIRRPTPEGRVIHNDSRARPLGH
jgi:hypothetical protein